MKKQNGFTLVEVIVVVAVLAAVVTIAMPDMNRLFYRQQEMTEAMRLKLIKKSLESYAKINRRLPANTSTAWYEDLTGFSELSELQIQKDVWGVDREYAVFVNNNQYLGADYNTYFAVVRSLGRDKVSNSSSPMPTNYAGFATFNLGTSTAENGGINDLAIKVTDQANKMDLLETTLNRMERLSAALTRYSRVKQISGIADIPRLSDQYIYFPKDGRTGDSGKYYEGTIAGGSFEGNDVAVSTDEGIASITGGAVGGGANEAALLATFLGLPSEYGKDALTDQTMWYISNPGPDSSCVGSRSEAPFYPPVILIDDSNPCP
ncbi:MAG: prepilin-type N-terminal cleavage/methylation domain-containing protein [Proteobacteria bacterium]|nr:prepilin-type N-terminal cleavage/methylation domain-containing protein [Pseudomonadota bacterium]